MSKLSLFTTLQSVREARNSMQRVFNSMRTGLIKTIKTTTPHSLNGFIKYSTQITFPVDMKAHFSGMTFVH